MESPMYSPPPVPVVAHSHHSADAAARPSLGFPLGTALLLVVIFTLSGIFSCCYHCDKFRSLRRAAEAAAQAQGADLESGGGDLDNGGDKNKDAHWISSEKTMQSLPVIMPGDLLPKFIALPSPCQPFRPDKLIAGSETPIDLKSPKDETNTTSTTTAAMTSPSTETTPPP